MITRRTEFSAMLRSRSGLGILLEIRRHENPKTMRMMSQPPRNRTSRPCLSGVPILASILLTSCVTSIDLKEVAQGAVERSHGPRPESEWNAIGIWRRIAEGPATYIPKDYPISAPRGEADGSWMVDARDGKRLFIPKGKVGDYESAVLLAEAKKITNWQARNVTSTLPGVIVMP